MFLFILTYVHVAFSRNPATCLDSMKDKWPKDGVLRVEVLRSGAHHYYQDEEDADDPPPIPIPPRSALEPGEDDQESIAHWNETLTDADNAFTYRYESIFFWVGRCDRHLFF